MFVNGKFWTVDTIYWSIVNEDLVEPYYLYNYLKILNFDGAHSGSTLPSMTSSAYYDIPIELPDKQTQKQIANILSVIDKKIVLNNKINFEIETFARTLYDYWFVQFDFPDGKGRPYKSSGGKMVYNEVLKREIPEGWEVGTFKACIRHINTGLNPRDNFILDNGNIKYVTVKNITTDGRLDFSNCDLVDEKAQKIIHDRSDISKGDILFASISPLGRCYLIQETPKDWDINESVFSIRPNCGKISSEYLYMYLTSEEFVKKAQNSSTGSIFTGIRIQTLENMKLIVPPAKIMKVFTESVSNVFKCKYMQCQMNSKLAEIRDLLLPILMNGQVLIKN
jgi:type I restriction enzyme S subunit